MQVDAPKADDRPPTAEVRIAQADVNTGLDEYRLGRPPAVSSASNLPEAKDIGQVADMKLPAGFVSGKQNSGNGGSSSFFQEYHSSADPDMKVYFEYRGHRMSPDSSSNFHQILAAPAHNLPQVELDKLQEVLQAKGGPSDFQISTAKTQDINGKRVLTVEGDYLKFGLRARTLYVDSDGSGSAVQEITFQAPTDRFKQNVVQGTKSLESIVWK
jgi:hypothetical protein